MDNIREKIEELESKKGCLESELDSVNTELNDLYQLESELWSNNEL